MTIYVCTHSLESLFTGIYDAWTSGIGQKNLQLVYGPIKQYELFTEYVEVVPDAQKTEKMMDAITQKISKDFYTKIAYASMAYEKDTPDIIFRMLLLAFHYGPSAVYMRNYGVVLRYHEIYKRYANEVHSFREFIRFHEVPGQVFIAHIEPKSHVVVPLGMHFADRMPSEHFIIVDDIHKEAILHPKDGECTLQHLREKELKQLQESELLHDGYTDLWKVFFDTIAITARKNRTCQRNLFPMWMRKHAVEFC